MRGLHPRLAREVEETLAFRAGEVFTTDRLARRLDRVEETLPFIDSSVWPRSSVPTPHYVEQVGPDGSRRIAPEPEVQTPAQRAGDPGWTSDKKDKPKDAKKADSRDDDDEHVVRFGHFDDDRRDRKRWDDDRTLRFDDDFEFDDHGHRQHHRSRRHRGNIEVVGRGHVVLWLRADHADFSQQDERLLRHTPVTGFAPGLAATLTLWDPADRVHVMLDGDLAWNSRRHNFATAPDATFFERAGSQLSIDWLIGARVRIPALRIAELGVQLFALTDTADSWRIAPVDSYLWSALINRPDAEYFRRTGVTAMLTFHLLDSLVVGGEVRVAREWGLNPPGKVWTLWNRDESPLAPAPVTDGEFGSVLARLEWSTNPTPLHKTGKLFRNPERSLVEREDPLEEGFTTNTTFEIGTPFLTGGTGARWTRLLSDNEFTARVMYGLLLHVRGRVAVTHDAPLQKQEGLGGFGALRGYDFKEFRGDDSLLGTVELRGRHFGAFVDVGSVHQDAGWIDPKAGVGAALYFGEITRLEAAWRLDTQAHALPDVRLLFGWDF